MGELQKTQGRQPQPPCDLDSSQKQHGACWMATARAELASCWHPRVPAAMGTNLHHGNLASMGFAHGPPHRAGGPLSCAAYCPPTPPRPPYPVATVPYPQLHLCPGPAAWSLAGVRQTACKSSHLTSTLWHQGERKGPGFVRQSQVSLAAGI